MMITRPVDRDVSAAITVIVSRHRDVTGKSPVLRRLCRRRGQR
jgi:hypothetical protein